MGNEQLLVVLGTLLLGIGGYIAACLKELTKSVQQLNINMAVVFSQQSNHEHRIVRLEQTGQG